MTHFKGTELRNTESSVYSEVGMHAGGWYYVNSPEYRPPRLWLAVTALPPAAVDLRFLVPLL